MLAAQRINDFITAYGKPICDGCIVRALDLVAYAQSSQITAALGTTSDFTRERGRCSVCNNERTVIYATRPEISEEPAVASIA
jgi:hypothetical protein